MRNSRGITRLFILTAIFFLAAARVEAADVIINELMSKNSSAFYDKDGDASDWFELKNTSDSAVSIAGWRVSSAGQSFTFPAGTAIGPRGYLLVWASGKNKIANGEIHTNFSLVETDPPSYRLELFDGAGALLESRLIRDWDELDQSVGYQVDGDPSSSFSGQAYATPGYANGSQEGVVGIVINEINEPFGWIELKNISALPIDIAGARLDFMNDTGAAKQISMPVRTVVPAGGYYVIQDISKIDEIDGLITLQDYDGLAIADSVDFPVASFLPEHSFGRFPDGTGGFTELFTPTKGAANVGNSSINGVVINEINEPFGWIELKNNKPSAVNIAGAQLRFTDDTGGNELIVMPAGASIPAGGYYVVQDISRIDEIDGLITLFDAGGTIADSAYFPVASFLPEHSFGRFPDGTGSFIELFVTTKGAANVYGSGQAGMVINEVMASNVSFVADEDGQYHDWIEIRNLAGSSAISLAGYTLSDDDETWTFPATLLNSEYLLVWASNKNRSGAQLHTNFLIASTGETLTLRDPQGNVVDQIDTDVMADNRTRGRFPGATDAFINLNPPTPGAQNKNESIIDPAEIELFINEVMAVNVSTLADADGQYSDWIEVKNAGDETLNLDGFVISNGAASWTFPAVLLPEDEYLLLWASGKDRAGSELHTNFTVSDDGQMLTIQSPAGDYTSTVTTGKMAADESFGYFPEGSGAFMKLNQATPGAPNTNDANAMPADLIGPTAGALLDASSVTFNWTTGRGVNEYWLGVGTSTLAVSKSPYGDIFGASLGQSTSALVTGIPLNGKPVYARLWSRIGSEWFFNDYVFTAASGGGEVAITSPAAGTVLTASTVTFTWSPSAAATEYWVGAGTSQISIETPPYGDIYGKNNGKSTSVAINGIPLNGNKLYVRIWYKVSGAWLFADHSFDTQSAGSTVNLTAPVTGSQISTPSVTFTWSPGSGVTQYWLGVGTSLVSVQTSPYGDIFAGDVGTATSKTVSGIPLNGNTLYARLWFKISGTWQYKEYSFSTANTGSGSGAGITSPVPGTTLTASTVTFTWSPAAGATEYFLGVGTSAASVSAKPWGNIYTGNVGINTQAVVSGVPATQKVFVRLWYKVSGSWQFKDYSYN